MVGFGECFGKLAAVVNGRVGLGSLQPKLICCIQLLQVME
jgi:hypothetical protein